jgi:hypothetical protein
MCHQDVVRSHPGFDVLDPGDRTTLPGVGGFVSRPRKSSAFSQFVVVQVASLKWDAWMSRSVARVHDYVPDQGVLVLEMCEPPSEGCDHCEGRHVLSRDLRGISSMPSRFTFTEPAD